MKIRTHKIRRDEDEESAVVDPTQHRRHVSNMKMPPICEVHDVWMLCYRSAQQIRYFRCPIAGCESTDKQAR